MSVASIVMAPNVSTPFKSFTNTLRFDMRSAANDNNMVINAGNPSGTQLTNTPIANEKLKPISLLIGDTYTVKKAAIKNTTVVTAATHAINLTKRSISIVIGDNRFFSLCAMLAI